MKGSAVVAIGVDRRGVDRDNSLVDVPSVQRREG